MVKAYLRYRHDIAFGIVASHGNALYDSTGEFFVTASLEGVAVWKSRTGERVALLLDEEATSTQRPIEVKSLARARREHLIAAGYSDGSIRIWDLSTYHMRTSFHGHKRPVSHLCFSASGELLASGSQDTHICLWDVIGETGLFKLQGHSHEITGLCFLKDRQLLVSVAKDGQLKLWDLTSQHCCQTVLHDRGVIWSLALHPRQFHVVIGSVDATLIIYELKEGEMPSLDVRMKVQRREEHRVRSLAFSENGEYLVCQGNAASAEIFEVVTEEVAQRRYEERRQKAERVLRELERKRAKEGSLNKKLEKKQRKNEKILQERQQDVALYQSLTTYQASSKLLSVDFRPGIRPELGIALGSNAFEMVGFEHSANDRKVLEYTQRLEVYREGHRSSIRSLCLSSDNQFLLSLSEKEAKIWNTETAICVHTLPSGYGLSGIFAPGDSVVVVGTKSGALELFDLLSSTKIESISAHEGPVWSITPIKEHKGFVSGGADGAVKEWNWGLATEEGDEIKRVTIRENGQSLRRDTDVLCVVLSADGRFLAVALLDATIQIYYVDAFQLFLTLYGHKLPVLSIDISADSQLIVSGSADKNIKIWGLDFGDCHKSIFAHKDSVTQVAFVHTTHYVMSVGKDGMLKYWDADKFELLLELAGHHAEIWCLSVSHEGSLVFTGSSDRSLRKWSRTNEPFFLEYEKEKRMEALFDEDPVEDLVPETQGLAGERSQTTLSAADSILEALELAALEAQRGSADPNPLLCGLEPAAFVLQAVQKIKPSDLEVALLSLPFTDALQLLVHLSDWLKRRSSQTEVICRVLVHLLRLHHRPLSTSLHVRSLLQNLQSSLRTVIGEMKDTIGFNLEAVRYIRSLTQNDEKTASM